LQSIKEDCQYTMKKINTILLLILVLFSACEWKLKPNEEDDQNGRIEVQRYDRLESRYLTTSDFSALQTMNTEYPVETRTLVEKVLQIGEVNDPEISDKFLKFYQDSVLLVLVADVEAEYANIDDLNSQFNTTFDKLKEWIPNIPVPRVYAQIGALDQSVIIGDRSIGICLDKYMGDKYPLYQKYYSYQQRISMTRSFIVPDCLSFYLLSLYPMDNYDNRTQIEKDLHMGKVMWVINKAMETDFFDTEYVTIIDRFMRKHPNLTPGELLGNNDYSELMP
jgi:hypothetical protein